MKVDRTITLEDTEGRQALVLTAGEKGVQVAYAGLRFGPPTVDLIELTEAVALLNQHGDS